MKKYGVYENGKLVDEISAHSLGEAIRHVSRLYGAVKSDCNYIQAHGRVYTIREKIARNPSLFQI